MSIINFLVLPLSNVTLHFITYRCTKDVAALVWCTVHVSEAQNLCSCLKAANIMFISTNTQQLFFRYTTFTCITRLRLHMYTFYLYLCELRHHIFLNKLFISRLASNCSYYFKRIMNCLREDKLKPSWVKHTVLNDILVWRIASTRLYISFFEFDNYQNRMTKERKYIPFPPSV